jgi:predicted nucleotidyltransferase
MKQERAPEASEISARIASALSPEQVRAGVVSVYLFGSHGEGRAHRESDVDVGVLLRRDVCPHVRDRFEMQLRLSGILQIALRTRAVDVVILNDAPPLLGRRIVTAGLRILCTDPEVDHAFVRDVQLRAADLEPFLRRMRRFKLDAIGR